MPLAGTLVVNAGDHLSEITTGTPVTSPSGRTPVHHGFDPLMVEEAFEAPAQVVTEIADEVIDIVKEIAETAGRIGSDVLDLFGQGIGILEWLLEHPAVVLGTVAVVGGIIVYIAIK